MAKGYKCKNCNTVHYDYIGTVRLAKELDNITCLIICKECNVLNGELKLNDKNLKGKYKRFNFGKYKGELIEDISDINYLLWVVETSTNVLTKYACFERVANIIHESFDLQKELSKISYNLKNDNDNDVIEVEETPPWE